jgi:tetratricopeptide (TPR) repeat protein
MSWWWFGVALAIEPAEIALAEGRLAQQAGRTVDAMALYQRCLELDPAAAACHWELGWSHYVGADWAAVVEQWTAVQRLDPNYPELDRWLPQAQAHLGSLTQLRDAARSAPDAVRVPVPAGKTLRLRAVGDLMLGTDFPEGFLPPDDGAHLLDPARDTLLDADVTFGNLEGPLCDSGVTTKCKEGGNCYAFRSPTRYGAWFANAGFDLLSTANNHSGDFDEGCRRETEATLDRLGIAWSGPPGTIASVERGGFQIAMVAFHTSAACNDVNQHERAAELVSLAAASHDLVVVSFHGGAEGSKALHVPDEMELFYGERRGHLRAFARVVIRAGADLVLGHGPHVPRGMEVIDGRLVAYSLGNFSTYGRFNLSGHLGTSLVLEVVLATDGALVQGRILPFKQVGDGFLEVDPAGTAIDLIRSLSDEDFPTTAPVIAKDGSFAPRAP